LLAAVISTHVGHIAVLVRNVRIV